MTVTRLQERRGIAAEWLAGDPNGDAIVLASGEIGLETDTNKFKIGDGVSTWLELEYQSLSNLTINSSSPLTLNTNLLGQKELSIIVGNSGVQAYSASLSNISSLNANTPGLLKKTGVNTWEIDTSVYSTTDTNYYPTAFTWTNGTTAGPTGSLTGSGMSAVSYAAIPAASDTQSGIITTGNQTFAGNKTFLGYLTSDIVYASSATSIGLIFNNITTGAISIGSGFTTGGTLNLGSTSGSVILKGTVKVGNTTISQGGTVTVTLPTTGGTLALNNQTHYIGTQAIAINSTSGSITSLPGVSNVNGATVPTSGTLATLANSETLTNKTLTTPILSSTTPSTAGAIGYDGKTFYAQTSTGLGAIDSTGYYIPGAVTIQAAGSTTLSSMFGKAFTVQAATTYEIEIVANITKGTTATSAALIFGLLLTTTTLDAGSWIQTMAAPITPSSAAALLGNIIAPPASGTSYTVSAAGATSNYTLRATGILRVGTGGTITPQIALSAAVAGATTLASGSYIRLRPVGSNTVTTVGL